MVVVFFIYINVGFNVYLIGLYLNKAFIWISYVIFNNEEEDLSKNCTETCLSCLNRFPNGLKSSHGYINGSTFSTAGFDTGLLATSTDR